VSQTLYTTIVCTTRGYTFATGELIFAFIGYEWSRTAFEAAAVRTGKGRRKLSTLESMAAGALAGSATVLITNPIWVVNTRMTARKNAVDEEDSSHQGSSDEALPTLQDPTGRKALCRIKPSTLATISAIIKEEGLGAFFAGVIPALVLVINPILQYTLFEQLKNLLEGRKKRRASPTDAFYLGAIAKLVATALTYPYSMSSPAMPSTQIFLTNLLI